jgi:hypothetical protein
MPRSAGSGLRMTRESGGRQGWARWRVLNDDDELVGFVAEDREWLGPPSYMAVHSPTGGAFEAPWKAEGFNTPRAAFEALRRHLVDV